MQQRRGVGAAGNADNRLRSGKSRQFLRLMHIARQQHQELGLPTGLIAQVDDVAGEQRHHFFRRNLLADARHPQKRAQRTGNGPNRSQRRGGGFRFVRLGGRSRGGPRISRGTILRSNKEAKTHRDCCKEGEPANRRFHGRNPLRIFGESGELTW